MICLSMSIKTRLGVRADKWSRRCSFRVRRAGDKLIVRASLEHRLGWPEPARSRAWFAACCLTSVPNRRRSSNDRESVSPLFSECASMTRAKSQRLTATCEKSASVTRNDSRILKKRRGNHLKTDRTRNDDRGPLNGCLNNVFRSMSRIRREKNSSRGD